MISKKSLEKFKELYKKEFGIIIIFVFLVGSGYFAWQYFRPSEETKAPKESETLKLSEKTEAPKTKGIKDNDLIMDTIKKESGASSELLKNSCVSSIMQETEDLILVYVDWNCGDVGGGARAILKKQSAQYKFIAMFQDPPSCNLMEKFSVPKSFYEACHDDRGSVQ